MGFVFGPALAPYPAGSHIRRPRQYAGREIAAVPGISEKILRMRRRGKRQPPADNNKKTTECASVVFFW